MKKFLRVKDSRDDYESFTEVLEKGETLAEYVILNDAVAICVNVNWELLVDISGSDELQEYHNQLRVGELFMDIESLTLEECRQFPPAKNIFLADFYVLGEAPQVA